MSADPSLNPMAAGCIREAAEELRDVPSLQALGLVLDKMEMRHAGSITGEFSLFEIREMIRQRIAAISER